MTSDSSPLERVRALIDQAQSIAFVVPEDTGYFSIDDELVSRVRTLVVDTIDLLRELTERYESASSGTPRTADGSEEDPLRGIGAQISSELAAREIADLAFVSRAQLQEARSPLELATAHRDVWAVAAHADRALRMTGKALIAVEGAICEYEGQEAPDRRWVDLEESLEIRRLYSQFRRAILRRKGMAEAPLRMRLRSAAHRIAILRDLKIYPYLRIADRKQIRSLQKRIEAWLEEDKDEQAGQRLWQDLVAFARLLAKVSDREELREHDLHAVRTAYRMLFQAGSRTQRLSGAQLSELERLIGRDDDLDELVLHPDRGEPQALRAVLERIYRELQPPIQGKLPPLAGS